MKNDIKIDNSDGTVYSELMIDLETLGQNENCVILSIGATFFDINKKEIGAAFYMPISIEEQMEKRVISPSTLKWWMGQSNAAKKVFSEQGQSLVDALENFEYWIKQHSKIKTLNVWGNGSTFDISIIEHAFRQYGYKIPWQYWNVMDLRTFKRFMAGGNAVVKKGTNHNALDDAISQAEYVIEHANRKMGAGD
jgi:hypothetical protein